MSDDKHSQTTSEASLPLVEEYEPYVGPRPFERADYDRFFARDRETDELLALIVAHRIVLLYAQSGAGKTSLINARLVPLLDEEGFEILPIARVQGLAPPTIELSSVPNPYTFSTLLSIQPSIIHPSEMTREALAKSLLSEKLAGYLTTRNYQRGSDGLPRPRLLIIDQFEEIFSAYPDRWRDRAPFFSQLRDALEADQLLHIVLAMREDYIAQLDPYASIIPSRLRIRYRLERLREQPALRAITGPLRGITFEPGVAEAIVTDLMRTNVETDTGDIIQVTGEYVEPVQLQLVCRGLWNSLPRGVTHITADDVRRYVNVDRELQNFYEKAVHAAAEKSDFYEQKLLDWCEEVLITAIGTRNIVYRGRDTTAGLPNVVVEELERQRLIRAELRAGARWYELSHDRLIASIRQSSIARRSRSIPERSLNLRSLFHDHRSFIESRLEGFVGREEEMAEIRERIARIRPAGGYVTITSEAGQGKSSVIARLVADAEAENGEDAVIAHFIPFNPGPDHQVGLLRNLLARLCLKHNLPEIYVASDSRPALRDYFAAALRELATRGFQETIYIDGLDQIEEDASGVRDLSFLPAHPPAGVVFVLGSRFDDTLKPLQLLKEHSVYQLPPLSRADFGHILEHRGVQLDPALADRFYASMEANALYLDLVVRELALVGDDAPESVIERVVANSQNLFTLTFDRLRRNSGLWREVLKPILGLLLCARALLSDRALRALIGGNSDEIRDGLLRLGGLLHRDAKGQYGLFHLQLRDYLRQDASYPEKRYVFATDEEESYHHILGNWCANGRGGLSAIWQNTTGDVLEQERRNYARDHYVTHLAAAKEYQQLWNVIDQGDYGQAKLRHDPSTRAYILDLDIARQSIIDAAGEELNVQVQLLPRLWQYSLLLCSLTSRVDHYPQELFTTLVALGRAQEAANLAELLTDPMLKSRTLQAIGATTFALGMPDPMRAFQRAQQTAETIADEEERATLQADLVTNLAQVGEWEGVLQRVKDISDEKRRASALHDLASTFVQAGEWERAQETAEAISDETMRIKVVAALAVALAQAGKGAEARATFISGQHIAEGITDAKMRAEAFAALVSYLAQAGELENARQMAETISESETRTEALIALMPALGWTGDRERTLQIAQAISDNKRRERALRDLASALAQSGEWEEARQIVEAISEEARTEALADLASALAQSGEWEKARQIVEAIPEEWKRVEALTALATALAQAGQTDKAATTFMAARQIVETIRDKDTRAQALVHVAAALAQAGQPAEAAATFTIARQIANAIPSEQEYTRALATLAAALAQAGQPAEAAATFTIARQTAEAIPNDQARSQALATLAAALAQAGQPAEAAATFAIAHQTVQTIADEQTRAEAPDALVSALVRVGQWEVARQTVQAITDERMRAEALRTLISALARADAVQPMVDLLSRLWCEAQTRNYLLLLFVVDAALLRAYPELGSAFIHSFSWVDDQLARG